MAGLDDGDLGIVGNNETRHAADGCKGARVGGDPIAERLCPVDDYRHRVAGVVHEQLVAAHMGLAHRERELGFPASVQLAEAGVAVALRIVLDVLVPEDR